MPRRRSWAERYRQALRDNQKTGAANSIGRPAIAGFCSLLQFRLGAVSPELIFEGACKKNLTYDQIRKLSDEELIELQWVEQL